MDIQKASAYTFLAGINGAAFGTVATVVAEKLFSESFFTVLQGAGIAAAHGTIASLLEEIVRPIFYFLFENYGNFEKTRYGEYILCQFIAGALIATYMGIAAEKIVILWIATRTSEAIVTHFIKECTTYSPEKLWSYKHANHA